MNFESTAEVPIPKDPLERVIGQDEAVKISRIVSTHINTNFPGTAPAAVTNNPPKIHSNTVHHEYTCSDHD